MDDRIGVLDCCEMHLDGRYDRVVLPMQYSRVLKVVRVVLNLKGFLKGLSLVHDRLTAATSTKRRWATSWTPLESRLEAV